MAVTFAGTSTVHVSDGATHLLVDGFFSRPSLARIALGRIAPDDARITEGLRGCGITTLDAVLVAHSHHDHAMDAPEVARRTGALLLGSRSTHNVGLGAGLPTDRMRLLADGDELTFGAFTVRVFESLHSHGDVYPGMIDAPLTPPVRASRYRTDRCYSLLVRHPQGSLLIHPSANVVPHQLDEHRADVVYLGVGALGRQDDAFHDMYWEHVVGATRPRLVVPIHWDDFGRPLSKGLRPMPFPLDRPRRTRALVARKAAESGVAVHVPAAFETIHPFAAAT